MLKYEKLFESFFLGGFECSTHYLEHGKRLDEVAATQHDRWVKEDYFRLREVNIRTAREGIRWHLIESSPGRYDFGSVLSMIRAARDLDVQVIWDLCHYGWPDWLDIFEPRFIDAFEKLASEFAKVLRNETDSVAFITPINEISFFSWGGGESAWLNPYAKGRGDELKDQLVRAAIAAIEAVWRVDPRTRICQIDPIINVLPADPLNEQQRRDAESYRLSQFQAWDMLGGWFKPQLGGNEKYLDIIGINYYVHNQWILNGKFIEPGHKRYKPFRQIITEAYERYKRPMFLAETGIEDEARPAWLRYVCSEVLAAMEAGAQIEGICLYPIVNHPGWVDDRHCYNGLWDYADKDGNRQIYEPLALELAVQQEQFDRLLQGATQHK